MVVEERGERGGLRREREEEGREKGYERNRG